MDASQSSLCFSGIITFSSVKNSPVCSSDWFTKVNIINNDEVEILKHYRLYGDEYDYWPKENLEAYKSPFKCDLEEAEGRIVTYFSILRSRNFVRKYKVVNPGHIFSY